VSRSTAKFLPYARHQILSEDYRAVADVLGSDHLAQGPEAGHFERALGQVTGSAFCASVSSGTAALHLALKALGVGSGDEIIVPVCTFVATANAVVLCGAVPVFADVEADTQNLCPEEVARKIGPRTKGAIAVHFAGHPADMDALRSALGGGGFLLEDACHALGAWFHNRSVGCLGEAACFSFHPAKLITTGEGGAITTNSEAINAKVRRLREHGIERKLEQFQGLGLPDPLRAEELGAWVYELHDVAPNYRLGEIAAALGRSQLTHMEAWLARRKAIVDAYQKALAHLEVLELSHERPNVRSAWHLFAIRLRLECLTVGRAQIFQELRARGIGVQVHYIPVHLQPYYRKILGTRFGDCPTAEDIYLRSLSLPLFPAMQDADVDRVVETLTSLLRRYRR